MLVDCLIECVSMEDCSSLLEPSSTPIDFNRFNCSLKLIRDERDGSGGGGGGNGGSGGGGGSAGSCKRRLDGLISSRRLESESLPVGGPGVTGVALFLDRKINFVNNDMFRRS